MGPDDVQIYPFDESEDEDMDGEGSNFYKFQSMNSSSERGMNSALAQNLNQSNMNTDMGMKKKESKGKKDPNKIPAKRGRPPGTGKKTDKSADKPKNVYNKNVIVNE